MTLTKNVVQVSFDDRGRRWLSHPELETISGDVLVRRAQDLIPTLRMRAQACEEARQMLPETLRDFTDAGFFRIVQPRRFGGFELGIDVLERVLIEVGRGCGSSSWTLGILAGHNWFAGLFNEAGQDAIFGADGHSLVSTTLSGRGRAKPVEGGYRISGSFTYQTGCDIATWHCVGAYEEDEAGNTLSSHYCMVRPEQARIEDRWYVLGMRGTGTKTVVIDDAFVPEHLTCPMPLVAAQEPPGAQVHANPFYRAPWGAFVFIEVTGAAVGVAQGAVDALEEIARTKQVRSRPGVAVSASVQMELPAMRRHMAEAKSLADTAKLLLLSEARRLMSSVQEYAATGRKFEREEMAEYALRGSRVVELSVQAVDHAFIAGGTAATFSGQPLERCFRDVHMMSTHNAYRFDQAAENWGLAHFGLPGGTR